MLSDLKIHIAGFCRRRNTGWVESSTPRLGGAGVNDPVEGSGVRTLLHNLHHTDRHSKDVKVKLLNKKKSNQIRVDSRGFQLRRSMRLFLNGSHYC